MAYPSQRSTQPARIGVCADDYGLTPGVSRGIRELLAVGRISATSVMAASEFWPGEAPALLAVVLGARKPLDIGLHVTLTDQRPLGGMPTFAPSGAFPPLPAVLEAGLSRRLPLAEIEAEIERQLAAFTAHFGAPPAHIDGHHHIHQLPGIRDIVLRMAQRLAPAPCYLRSCVESTSIILRRGVATPKALLISALGRGLSRRASAAGVLTNTGFSGVYDFARERRPLAEVFARFLQGAGERHIMMCHPGYSDAVLAGKDPLTTARETELAFLASDAWPRLIGAAGLEIGSLRPLARRPSAGREPTAETAPSV